MSITLYTIYSYKYYYGQSSYNALNAIDTGINLVKIRSILISILSDVIITRTELSFLFLKFRELLKKFSLG